MLLRFTCKTSEIHPRFTGASPECANASRKRSVSGVGPRFNIQINPETSQNQGSKIGKESGIPIENRGAKRAMGTRRPAEKVVPDGIGKTNCSRVRGEARGRSAPTTQAQRHKLTLCLARLNPRSQGCAAPRDTIIVADLGNRFNFRNTL
jgi:hypothetical protein